MRELEQQRRDEEKRQQAAQKAALEASDASISEVSRGFNGFQIG